MTDHFTKFAAVVPTKDQKAKTIAKAFWENFIVHYGFPSRILSDQGKDFESHTIRELCALIGADNVRTTPYLVFASEPRVAGDWGKSHR